VYTMGIDDGSNVDGGGRNNDDFDDVDFSVRILHVNGILVAAILAQFRKTQNVHLSGTDLL